MYCGQTVAWIKMPLGRASAHATLRWMSTPRKERGGAQQPRPTFRPMYYGQTAGRIKVPLGTEVGLDSSHCVRLGPSSLPQKGQQPPIFGPCLLRPNCWMDQDATWYEGRSRPRQHCVRWGPSPPPPKGAQAPSFRPMSNVYCGQTVAHLSYC